MTMAGVLRKTALAALVVLPLSAAAVYIVVVARDTSEIASALLAAAGFLSIASFLQIGLLLRETRALSQRQEQTRQQALALARCMRDLNHRMSAVETGEAGEREVDPAPTAPVQPPVAVVPQPRPRLPVRAEAKSTEEIRILSLPHRQCAGLEIQVSEGGVSPFHAMAGIPLLSVLIDAALARLSAARPPSFVLVNAGGALSDVPVEVQRLVELAGRVPALRTAFLLGVSQQQIRHGGMAEANELARLARAGLKFALTGITDLRIDAAALSACSISHVRIGARVLMAAGREGEALAARLAAGGITLIADGVDSPRLVPELIDMEVTLAQGDALEDAPVATPAPAPAPAPAMPWRADTRMPPSPPPLSASADDSIRYRAAG